MSPGALGIGAVQFDATDQLLPEFGLNVESTAASAGTSNNESHSNRMAGIRLVLIMLTPPLSGFGDPHGDIL